MSTLSESVHPSASAPGPLVVSFPASVVAPQNNRRRVANWTWSDSFQMIRLVAEHGKNYGKVLDLLHDLHRVTHIADKEKVRKKYNDLADKSKSQLFKSPELEIPSFELPKGQTFTDEERMNLTMAHIKEHQRINQERLLAITYINQIEEKEIRLVSEKKMSEAQVKAKMDEKAGERRETIDSRRKTMQEAVEEETTTKKSMNALCGAIVTYLAVATETSKNINEMMMKKKRKRSESANNNL